LGEIYKMQKADEKLRFTGERVTFDTEGQAVYEHLHRYFFAREICRGLDVLDVASGEGYGGAYLAQTARSVVGVDISAESVTHADECYATSNLRYEVGNATSLNFADASFDAVVSFETIEHLDDQKAFLKEIRRVLRPKGLLIVSSPNRDLYSPVDTPPNPFHVRELTRDELLAALGAEFRFCMTFAQRPLTGTLLIAESGTEKDHVAHFRTFERRGQAHFESSEGLARPLYFLVVASNSSQVPLFSSVYIETGDVDASIRYRGIVDELRSTSNAAVQQAREAAANSEAEAERLRGRLASAIELGRKSEQNAAQNAWLHTQIRLLSDERDNVARELSKAYRRPWRPAKYLIYHYVLRALSAASGPFSREMAARLKRSAQKRSPTRFDRSGPGEVDVSAPVGPLPVMPIVRGGRILTQDDARLITRADVDEVSLPTHETPLVSVIIPSYGKAWLTLQCLRSIADNPPSTSFEVIVVDDASGDPDIELLRLVKGLRLEINTSNLGFLRSCNRAAEEARGDYLFLLNNDTLVCTDWLEPLLAVFQAFPDAGLAGSKLLFPDGSLQEAGGIVWNDGSAWNYGRSDDPAKPEYNYVRQADYISGCAILVPRPLWRELHGFDEHFVPGYCEDTDLAFRIRAAGKTVYYCPFSVVVHLEGASHGRDLTSGIKAYQVVNTKKLFERWRETLTAEHWPNGSHIMRARDRSRNRKIALIVDHYVPEPDQDAGSRAMMAVIRALLDWGYVLKFWPDNLNYSAEYTPLLQGLGIETLYGHYRSFGDWIRENGEEIALAVLSRPDVAARYVPELRAHSDATIAYYGHDLHFRRLGMEAEAKGDSELAAKAADMEALERSIWRAADIVIYLSEEEAAVAHQENARAAAIVPYAYDDFANARVPPQDREIIFVAGFGHTPNADAAVWLVNEILPKIVDKVPDARLAIVGSNPTEAVRALASDRVEVTGQVSEEELRARYASARLALVPLCTGAGVKSKVVEALREGLPLVTTSVGVQGLPGVEHIVVVADDAQRLADAGVELLRDNSLWAQVSRQQIEYARENFSLDAFSRSLEKALGRSI